MKKILSVGLPQVSCKDGWWRLSASLRIESAKESILAEHQQEIWFALQEQYAEEFVFPDCCDCFLFGLLYFAMKFGYDIHLKGAVSKLVVHNVNEEVIPLMAAHRPVLHTIHVSADDVKDYPEGKYVGTGFSGGIDSFYTIVDNLRHSVYPEDVLTHLFFFNVGTHDLARSFEELKHARMKFMKRYERSLPAAREIGLPFIPIDSNVHSFLPDNISAALSPSNASAIHFLRKGIRRYLLSSAGQNYVEWFKYMKYTKWEDQIDLAHMEPILCQWLGDRTLKILPYGSNVSRLEKTQELMDYKPAQHCLNVCNSVDTMEKNCSVCIKCRRTMLDLELLGKLDDFHSAFDVDLYRRKYKSRDFAEMLYPPPEEENLFLHRARRYADAHHIDIKSQCTTMDRFCAYLHQTWFYRLLKSLRLLDAAKLLLGRH